MPQARAQLHTDRISDTGRSCIRKKPDYQEIEKDCISDYITYVKLTNCIKHILRIPTNLNQEKKSPTCPVP